MGKGIVQSTLLLIITFALGSGTVANPKCSVGGRVALSANLTSYFTTMWTNMDFSSFATKKRPGLTNNQRLLIAVRNSEIEERTTRADHVQRVDIRSSSRRNDASHPHPPVLASRQIERARMRGRCRRRLHHSVWIAQLP